MVAIVVMVASTRLVVVSVVSMVGLTRMDDPMY